MKRLLLLALLFALPAHAQSIQNPSFEAAQPLVNASPAGPWEQGAIPGWAVTGTAGLWQPSSYTALPDGKTVAWSNGGSVAQDLGVPAQANTTYMLSVSVGHRADDFATTYTVTLNAGTNVLCMSSASNAAIPLGTFQKITLACPVSAAPAGNLVITLASSGVQANFDAVSLTSAPSIPPQPDSVQIHGQLKWCAKCDGSDNVPATGFLLISQTGGGQESVPINPDGTVGSTATGALFTFDISLDPLEFVLSLTDANGAVQPGASLKLTFPRFELNSAGFTLGNVTLGIVRIAHTVDDAGNPAVRIVDVSAFSLVK